MANRYHTGPFHLNCTISNNPHISPGISCWSNHRPDRCCECASAATAPVINISRTRLCEAISVGPAADKREADRVILPLLITRLAPFLAAMATRDSGPMWSILTRLLSRPSSMKPPSSGEMGKHHAYICRVPSAGRTETSRGGPRRPPSGASHYRCGGVASFR
jgi:hypothetical protein